MRQDLELDNRTTSLEHAFQLANSGKYANPGDIKAQMKAKRFSKP